MPENEQGPEPVDHGRPRDARTGQDAVAARIAQQATWVDLQIRQAMEKGLLDMDDAIRMIDEHRLVVEHQITLVDDSVAARKARQKKLKAQITREVEKFLATVDDEAPVRVDGRACHIRAGTHLDGRRLAGRAVRHRPVEPARLSHPIPGHRQRARAARIGARRGVR